MTAAGCICISGRIFSSGKLLKTASECKTQFLCSPQNFIKDNIWFCSADQTKNYFQTNPGSLQFICKCFFISNLFKLNDYFQLEIFSQNSKCFDLILANPDIKYISETLEGWNQYAAVFDCKQYQNILLQKPLDFPLPYQKTSIVTLCWDVLKCVQQL